LRTAARNGWAAPTKDERLAAINETKWRLQQLGGTAERIRVLSLKASWRFQLPPRKRVSISMREEMASLRRSLTDDPFEDPKRRARPTQAMIAEDNIGVFLAALEPKIRTWLAPGDA